MFKFLDRFTSKREASYTDAVVSGLLSVAADNAGPNAQSSGALELAAGLIGRSLASATVTGSPVLTPSAMLAIARDLVRRGESVWAIRVSPSMGASIIRASGYNIEGDFDENAWMYDIDLPGPSSSLHLAKVPSSAVLHFRYLTDPAVPWRGLSPAAVADSASRFAGIERRLAEENQSPTGYVLPTPIDGADESLEALKTDLRQNSGKLSFVQSTPTFSGAGSTFTPASDWTPRRLGAAYPEPVRLSLSDSYINILAINGVPASLYNPRTMTESREGYRRFIHQTLTPLARLVKEEFDRKMMTDIQIDLTQLGAADIASKARAVASMVSSGIDVSVAMQKAGLE